MPGVGEIGEVEIEGLKSVGGDPQPHRRWWGIGQFEHEPAVSVGGGLDPEFARGADQRGVGDGILAQFVDEAAGEFRSRPEAGECGEDDGK